jgi:hypothetical protein
MLFFVVKEKKCKKCLPKKYFLTCSCRFLHTQLFADLIICSNFNTSNVFILEKPPAKILKSILFQKKFSSSTFQTNVPSNLKSFTNSWPSASNLHNFSPMTKVGLSSKSHSTLLNFFSYSRSEQFLKQNTKIYLSSMSINYRKPHFFTQLRMPSLQIAFFFRTFSQNLFGFCMQHIF